MGAQLRCKPGNFFNQPLRFQWAGRDDRQQLPRTGKLRHGQSID
jgi:hypothetical protein